MLLLQWSKIFLCNKCLRFLLRCQNKKMGQILIFWTNQKPREFLRYLIIFCCLGCQLWSQVFLHHHPNWIIRYNDVKVNGFTMHIAQSIANLPALAQVSLVNASEPWSAMKQPKAASESPVKLWGRPSSTLARLDLPDPEKRPFY